MNADEFPPWEATIAVLTSLLDRKCPLPTVGALLSDIAALKANRLLKQINNTA